MKTVIKIDPEKEYGSAKKVIESMVLNGGFCADMRTLDGSIDNLKTVINVLMERLTPKKKKPRQGKDTKKKEKNKVETLDKLPSEKFPELQVTENIITPDEPPSCPCCGDPMKESGLFKVSEKLEVVPAQYHINRNMRVIFSCRSCSGGMVNTPAVPSILPTSNYGDSVIIDATLSKYCDLIPMERYSAIAARVGVEGLPPNSLIGLTHSLASFLEPVYKAIKSEVQSSKLVLADETPHKMLEGDETSNWFLWSFGCESACCFEAHGTRSGDVPINFLQESQAEFLMTDGYSGYKRCISELARIGRVICEVYCNAHAYRYFEIASGTWQEECTEFLDLYGKIYDLEREAQKTQDASLISVARDLMRPLFAEIKEKCEAAKLNVMAGSKFEIALNYFLNHFNGLTRCLENPHLPLDNNWSERHLRPPVVGRKTWYGTHSKRGAKTNATHFSIVESCKINGVNPRIYYRWVVGEILAGREPLTPSRFARLAN